LVKQVPKLCGIEKGSGDFFDQLLHLIRSLGHTNPWTLAVGATALAITFGLGAVAPRVPSALVVFVGGIFATALFGLNRHGVEIVGTIPGGLPHIVFPNVGRDNSYELLSGAIGIVLVMYAEALAAARTFAAKNNYEINANQELAALGAANICCGLTQGL